MVHGAHWSKIWYQLTVHFPMTTEILHLTVISRPSLIYFDPVWLWCAAEVKLLIFCSQPSSRRGFGEEEWMTPDTPVCIFVFIYLHLYSVILYSLLYLFVLWIQCGFNLLLRSGWLPPHCIFCIRICICIFCKCCICICCSPPIRRVRISVEGVGDPWRHRGTPPLLPEQLSSSPTVRHAGRGNTDPSLSSVTRLTFPWRDLEHLVKTVIFPSTSSLTARHTDLGNTEPLNQEVVWIFPFGHIGYTGLSLEVKNPLRLHFMLCKTRLA